MSIIRADPRTSDGKPLVTSNALPEWCILGQVGRGDSATEIGGGTQFQISADDPAIDSTLEFSFLDAVYVTSGVGVVQNAQLGDWLRFEVTAPATVPTSTPGAGNCNKVATGLGFDIIVPAAGGDWTIDLQSADCHLVPNKLGGGYWDWDMVQTGAGEIVPAAGNGRYDLYTAGMRLSKFATDVPLLGTDVVLHFGIENVRAKMIPPHWHWVVTLHCGSLGHDVKCGFYLQVGRARTYVNAVMA